MTTTDNVFRLLLTGPGVNIEKEIGQEAALAIMQIALSGNTSFPVLAAPGTARAGPKVSLREFLDEAGARSNPEKIVAFAAFLRDHQQQEDYSRDDLRACFRAAGEALPGNFARDFQMAVQNGWIAEEHGKPGRYYLTRKGDDAIRRKTGNSD